MIGTLFDPAAWGSPIGLGMFLVFLGLFLAGLGVYEYLHSLADKNKKRK